MNTVQLEESPELLKSLYSRAYEMLRHKPWKHVDESFVIGFENFRTKKIFYIHVIGALDEYQAISFYRGGRGLYFLMSLYDSPSHRKSPFEVYLTCDKLELSFDAKSYLMPRDHELIKISGVSFPSRGRLPMFRRYQPGYYPWFIHVEEAEFINMVLTFLMNIISDMKRGRLIIASLFEERKITVFHTSRKNNRQIYIMVRDEPLPNVEAEIIHPVALNELRLKKIIKEKKHRDAYWEVGGSFYSEELLQESEESAPFYPFILLYVDSGSGFVLHNDLSSRDKVPEAVVEGFLQTVETVGFIPSHVFVEHEHFLEVLSPLQEKLHFICTVKEKLPMLEEALMSMEAFSQKSSRSSKARKKTSARVRKKKK